MTEQRLELAGPFDDLAPGTRVRVVLDGYVSGDRHFREVLLQDRDGTTRRVGLHGANGWAQVEVLEQARPVWWPPQELDVVLYDGWVLQRRDNEWCQVGTATAASVPDGDSDMLLLARDRRPYWGGGY